MKHIMLDLETLGIQENAVILSAGAVKFDLDMADTWDTLNVESRSFYATIDVDEQIHGLFRQVEKATADWWDQQPQQAKDAVFKVETFPVQDFIEAFNGFCEGAKYLWARGIGFDCNKLRHLYHQTAKPFPFKYNKEMDCRTAQLILQPTTEVVIPQDLIAHHALTDAQKQTLELQSWIRSKGQWLKDQRPGSAIQ